MRRSTVHRLRWWRGGLAVVGAESGRTTTAPSPPPPPPPAHVSVPRVRGWRLRVFFSIFEPLYSVVIWRGGGGGLLWRPSPPPGHPACTIPLALSVSFMEGVGARGGRGRESHVAGASIQTFFFLLRALSAPSCVPRARGWIASMTLGTTAPRARHVQTENFASSSRAFLSLRATFVCVDGDARCRQRRQHRGVLGDHTQRSAPLRARTCESVAILAPADLRPSLPQPQGPETGMPHNSSIPPPTPPPS